MRVVALALGLLLLASGCELIADFDRSKIPGMNVDSGKPDEEDAGTGDAAVSGDAATGDDAGGE